MRFWPQDEHKSIYAFSWLKHVVVVLRKSEGTQKWLAPCGTDVHRVALTIDVSILEKDSHSQNKITMQNEVLIAQNMENLGAISLCLLEQLRPSLRTLTSVTYYWNADIHLVMSLLRFQKSVCSCSMPSPEKAGTLHPEKGRAINLEMACAMNPDTICVRNATLEGKSMDTWACSKR
jgi:hypothetical protein